MDQFGNRRNGAMMIKLSKMHLGSWPVRVGVYDPLVWPSCWNKRPWGRLLRMLAAGINTGSCLLYRYNWFLWFYCCPRFGGCWKVSLLAVRSASNSAAGAISGAVMHAPLMWGSDVFSSAGSWALCSNTLLLSKGQMISQPPVNMHVLLM